MSTPIHDRLVEELAARRDDPPAASHLDDTQPDTTESGEDTQP